MRGGVEVELEEAAGKEGGLAAADALGESSADEEQGVTSSSSGGGGGVGGGGSSSGSSSKGTWWSTRFAAVNRQAWLVIIMYLPLFSFAPILFYPYSLSFLPNYA